MRCWRFRGGAWPVVCCLLASLQPAQAEEPVTGPRQPPYVTGELSLELQLDHALRSDDPNLSRTTLEGTADADIDFG